MVEKEDPHYLHEESHHWCAMFGKARLKYFTGENASLETRKFMRKFAEENFELITIN